MDSDLFAAEFSGHHHLMMILRNVMMTIGIYIRIDALNLFFRTAPATGHLSGSDTWIVSLMFGLFLR